MTSLKVGAADHNRLNISHLIMLRKVKFYKHLFLSANSVLHNVFNFVLVHNYSGDDMHDATNSFHAAVSSS